MISLIRTAYDTEGRAVEDCDTVMVADAYVLAYQLHSNQGMSGRRYVCGTVPGNKQDPEKQTKTQVPDLGLHRGAGDGNRTRALSLGSTGHQAGNQVLTC
ncbi:hypothetical protein SAMN05421870_102199 [Streptomyces qinglanensis]|uniref:Uncharacterized protein n=1 Tax=Streptomyces qinglanensis TaxID=943816 RepID=A0A1H9PQZ6_9ACTN|nr:hypothetical protein [Streptomyces qinglanensis]SER50756.1 hypothetical protein SAMN05421870_102199 [Streptomyces qinglanensis]